MAVKRISVCAVALATTVLAGCGSSPSASESHPATSAAPRGTSPAQVPTTAPTPTTGASVPSTTAPSASVDCPPGCRYPSTYDAITVLASSSTLVAVVTAHALQTPNNGIETLHADDALQGNLHGLVYPVSGDFPDTGAAGVVAGRDYLVFMSYNRGGACVAALYSFDERTQVATFLATFDGLTAQSTGEIPVGGKLLRIPKTISLADVRGRMYPTGDVVYPSDASESGCPGP